MAATIGKPKPFIANIMRCDKLKSVLAHVGNAAIVVVVIAVTLAMRKNIVKPIRNGFFCGDPTIWYPVREEAVSTKLIILMGTLSMLVIALVTEYFQDSGAGSRRASSYSCGVFTLAPWLVKAGCAFFLYLLGFCITVLFFELGKAATGVLRPSFMAICQPNVDCKAADPFEYHLNYTCLKATEEEEADLRKSFPSGHAAAVSFISLFICIYLQQRPRAFGGCFLLRPLIQLVACSLAWVTSLTRITDYVHHVSDVLVGLVLGAAVAIWFVSLVWEVNEARNQGGAGQNGEAAPLEMSIKSCNASESEAEFKPSSGPNASANRQSNHVRVGNVRSS